MKSYVVEGEAVEIKKYPRKGKPENGEEPIVAGYSIKSTLKRNEDEIVRLLNKKGRFILATNDLNKETYTDQQVLEDYKGKQGVEGGFRFLKDPWFMLDSIFLKLPSRIEALMMVMTSSLLVYNLGQYQLRENLKKNETTLPNQINKEIQTPTLRWIFQIMEGISIIRYHRMQENLKDAIVNLSALRKKIISLFGETAMILYGLIPKSCV
jgi:transposase